MREEDIAALLAWPHTNICSDGSADSGHPRGWGAFPRVLSRYVRQLGVLTLEQAVHKMTALAARHVGLSERGVIATGAPADLVLFDPATIADRSTFEEPNLPAAGIAIVWVNGVAVYRDGAPTGARPGRVLRRPPL
jgi:N-acyl-D-amino-acid deacylase